MKISYNALNTFFDGKLPTPEVLGDALTFHAWEIEEIVPMDGDTMIDVKVLPDKSSWALSHRGIAKDVSVILNIPLAYDPLSKSVELSPIYPDIDVRIEAPMCTRYTAALIKDVKVGPSPAWVVEELRTLGQRSINNIVDITNLVMFRVGQPLHAFDAAKLGGESILVRTARHGEVITTLTGETYTLSEQDALIVDGVTDVPVGIAGIKGGKIAEVDTTTTDILLESANFNAVTVRKTSQRLRLRTDASQRYENGIVSDMTVYSLTEAVRMIAELAGGVLVGYADTGSVSTAHVPVSVSLEKINSVLGLTLTMADVETIMQRFGYVHTIEGSVISVTPPFERTDLIIPEDLIEEVGRIHGYLDVPSITPKPLPLAELNARFYYGEKIRTVLTNAGFSEVYTSSFKKHDEVKLTNALASDKGYLRSNLAGGIGEALQKNNAHKDLLGIPYVGLFEIGSVFRESGETYRLAFGVRHAVEYKEKTDGKILAEVKGALEAALGIPLAILRDEQGIIELDMNELLARLSQPVAYEKPALSGDVTYASFSLYPAMSRDIALWVEEGTLASDIAQVLNEHAGPLCARTTLFDAFTKDGKTSYAFRLVFQSYEKTLTDEEVNAIMDGIYKEVATRGWIVR